MATNWTNETDSQIVWADEGIGFDYWVTDQGAYVITDTYEKVVVADNENFTGWTAETDATATWTNVAEI